MSDSRHWFAPKRYGYGSGLPISWQGWALTVGCLSIVLALALAIGRSEPLQFIAAMILPTVGFCIICARTTKGGWRWRWGDED